MIFSHIIIGNTGVVSNFVIGNLKNIILRM